MPSEGYSDSDEDLKNMANDENIKTKDGVIRFYGNDELHC